MKRLIFAAVALFTIFAMVGCPTDTEDDPPPKKPTVTGVTITTTDSSIIQDGTAVVTKQFAATVQGTNGPSQGVTWAVAASTGTGSAPAGITINADSGLVSVATTVTTGTQFTVIATSKQDTTKKSTPKVVTVYANQNEIPVISTVVVAPKTASTTVGTGVLLAATVTGTNTTLGVSDTVTWTVTPATASFNPTTTASGVNTTFTATAAGTYNITATSTVDGTKKDTATVTVNVSTGPQPPPPQEDDVVRFLYNDGTYLDIPFVAGDTTWANIKAYRDYDWDAEEWVQYKDDKWTTDQTKTFGGWKDTITNTVYNYRGTDHDADILQDKLTLEPVWWSTVLTATEADAEKVRLENASFVVYEFTLPAGTTLTDITGIDASYKLSEATLKLDIETRVRAFGPYFFNNTASKQDTQNPVNTFWGDFAIDGKQAFIARFHSSGSAGQALTDYNKLNPYMLNGPQVKLSNFKDNTNTAVTLPTTDLVANEWFNITYNFDANATGDYTYGKSLANLTASNDAHLGAGTDKQKVYFAIGITVWNGNYSKDRWEPDPLEPFNGVVQLIKGVTLKTSKGNIVGAKPSLSVTSGGTTAASNQVFGSYIDPINFNWRGPVANPVQIPEQDGLQPPPPPEPPNPNLEPLIIEGEDLVTAASIFGNLGYDSDGKQTTTQSQVAIQLIQINATDKITLEFDLDEFAFNTGQNKTGLVEKTGVITPGEPNPYFELSGDELKEAVKAILQAEAKEELGDDFDQDEFDTQFEYDYDEDDYDTVEEWITEPVTGPVYESETINGKWGGGGIKFTLPAGWTTTYSSVTIEYEATIETGPAGDSYFVTNAGAAIPLTYAASQISPRVNGSYGDLVSPATNEDRYQNLQAGTGKTLRTLTSTMFPDGNEGIWLVVQAYANNAVPTKGTFKVTKITLTPN